MRFASLSLQQLEAVTAFDLSDVLARAGQPAGDSGMAMAKDPRRRFPSAQSFALAFIAARRGNPVALEVPADAWL